jgi:hypothetical protein
MSEGRRLAAILAVNVVGYSRLMSEDEAGTGWDHWSRRIIDDALANAAFPPTAASTVAIRNGRFRSICDVQTVTTNVHVGSK